MVWGSRPLIVLPEKLLFCFAHAYEMGQLVSFLCSKGAGYITSVDILADGGFTYGSAVPQIR